jgi:hypothetical protein
VLDRNVLRHKQFRDAVRVVGLIVVEDNHVAAQAFSARLRAAVECPVTSNMRDTDIRRFRPVCVVVVEVERFAWLDQLMAPGTLMTPGRDDQLVLAANTLMLSAISTLRNTAARPPIAPPAVGAAGVPGQGSGRTRPALSADAWLEEWHTTHYPSAQIAWSPTYPEP